MYCYFALIRVCIHCFLFFRMFLRLLFFFFRDDSASPQPAFPAICQWGNALLWQLSIFIGKSLCIKIYTINTFSQIARFLTPLSRSWTSGEWISLREHWFTLRYNLHYINPRQRQRHIEYDTEGLKPEKCKLVVICSLVKHPRLTTSRSCLGMPRQDTGVLKRPNHRFSRHPIEPILCGRSCETIDYLVVPTLFNLHEIKSKLIILLRRFIM